MIYWPTPMDDLALERAKRRLLNTGMRLNVPVEAAISDIRECAEGAIRCGAALSNDTEVLVNTLIDCAATNRAATYGNNTK